MAKNKKSKKTAVEAAPESPAVDFNPGQPVDAPEATEMVEEPVETVYEAPETVYEAPESESITDTVVDNPSNEQVAEFLETVAGVDVQGIIEAPAAEPVSEPAAPAVTTVTATIKADELVYIVDPARSFKPRRGLETVLYAAFSEPHSVSSVVDSLLDSGEYTRVAPMAAINRPRKPVDFLVKTWVAGRILRLATPEVIAEAAANRATVKDLATAGLASLETAAPEPTTEELEAEVTE